MTWMDKKKELIANPKIVNGKPLFSFVEFNVSNYCNRDCSFCPLVKPKDTEFMPFELFKKAIDELHDLEFSGLIGFSGFCEPTLHSRIADFILYTRTVIPEVTIVINSNGDNITKESAYEYKTVGLSYLIVSAYDKATHTRIDEFSDDDYILVNKRYDGDMIKNNRAGALYTAVHNIDNPCYYPFYMVYIDWNGDVLFCSHNYDKEGLLGNIIYHSIYDIWLGDEMTALRKDLKIGRHMNPCNKCDVIGTMMGEENYEAWQS